MIDTRLSTAGHPTAFEAEKPFSVFQRIAKKRLFGWLDRLSDGTIQFADSQDSRLFGDADSDAIQAHWNVEDGGFYSHVFRSGSLGMAESYLRGDWHSDNLTNLLAVLYRHQRQDREGRSFTTAFSQLFGRIVQQLNGNTLRGSRRHIAAHYDLSNEFFELFLDPTMMYSAAFFEHDDFSLHEASIAKLNQLCKKLDLQPNDRVLETGTGWGGFAIHAVQEFGIDLTTTTISAAQFKRARQRIADADIENKVRLLDTDYRKLTGQYDKIVSIEMVEAVGERYLDTYFRQCGKLLKPGGRFVLQAIVMPEERYDSYRRGVDFIQKYIFPGGFLPSVAALQQSVGRTSDLRLQGIEDLSPHYARTLREWRTRFFRRLEEVRQLGFDDRFIRMWEYYLCYCEAAFQEQAVRVVQIVWDKPVR